MHINISLGFRGDSFSRECCFILGSVGFLYYSLKSAYKESKQTKGQILRMILAQGTSMTLC